MTTACKIANLPHAPQRNDFLFSITILRKMSLTMSLHSSPSQIAEEGGTNTMTKTHRQTLQFIDSAGGEALSKKKSKNLGTYTVTGRIHVKIVSGSD